MCFEEESSVYFNKKTKTVHPIKEATKVGVRKHRFRGSGGALAVTWADS